MIDLPSDIRDLSCLLGCRTTDKPLVQFLGSLGNPVGSDYARYVSLKTEGISLQFKKEEWVKEEGAQDFVATALFVYGQGYEGYDQYRGGLLLGACFGDTREVVRQKLGQPVSTGGGHEKSFAPGKTWPHWDQHAFSQCIVHTQFSDPPDYRLVLLYLTACANP